MCVSFSLLICLCVYTHSNLYSVVKGNLKVPFSIAATLRCWIECYYTHIYIYIFKKSLCLHLYELLHINLYANMWLLGLHKDFPQYSTY